MAVVFLLFFRWAELDLNQRRRSQRIYSPPPLTTRASTLCLFFQANLTIYTYCTTCNTYFQENQKSLATHDLVWRGLRKPIAIAIKKMMPITPAIGLPWIPVTHSGTAPVGLSQ